MNDVSRGSQTFSELPVKYKPHRGSTYLFFVRDDFVYNYITVHIVVVLCTVGGWVRFGEPQ